MRKKRPPHILAVLPTATHTQRQYLEGLLEYAHRHADPPWQFHLDLGDLNMQTLRRIDEWGCDGIVAFVMGAGERRRFLKTGLPAVLLDPTGRLPPPRSPRAVFLTTDHLAEGRLAADHFLARGYRSFAYVGSATPATWCDDRRDGFMSRVSARGLPCAVYPPIPPEEQNDFALEYPRLLRFLRTLPRQTALFAVHDRRAQQIVSAALAAGLRIPEDIAVLGVDNDTLLCETTVPSISSIETHAREGGRMCGEILNDLLRGRPRPPRICNMGGDVVVRRSTDAAVGESPVVTGAVSYIQSNLAAPLRVGEIARVCGVSAKVLQARARRAFGCPLGDEIRRRRLLAAARLLRETRRTVDDIAISCGFCGASHLGVYFKPAYGASPREWRRQAPRAGLSGGRP